MDALTPTQRSCAAIRNASYLVRHNRRMREQRRAALHELGLVVRQVFAESDDFEPMLVALVDGLNPRDEAPRF